MPAEHPASLRGIQALRAAAALAVVAYHTAGVIGAASPALLLNGAAGVDVFFVISGFVMVVSSRRLEGRGSPARRFLRARLRRIVPLYWVCSAAKILAMLAVPSLARGTVSLGYCLASLLFLPVHDAAGQFKPVLPAGWTLSFEMMFYALFAGALALRWSAALCVPAALAAITLTAAVLQPRIGVAAELGNPIVLEFAFGTTLAALWLRGWRLPTWLAWPLLAAAVAPLMETPRLALGGRMLSWGMPATLLVAAVVSLERNLAALLPKVVLALGAASYAIYLTHGFALDALAAALPFMPRCLRGAAVVLPASLAASAIAGWLVHTRIEKTILHHETARTTRSRTPAVLVLAGGGLSPLSGGVGTLMRYLTEAWAGTQAPPRLRVVDTRGSGGAMQAALRFCWSVCLVASLGATRRIDVVHAHMTTRGSAARKVVLCAIAMLLGVPVILHMHGADFFTFHNGLPKALSWPLHAVLRRSRHVVVLGAGWRAFLLREVGLSPARISIVPNGVPPAPGCPKPAAALPCVLFLGRLCDRKGVPELISALATPSLQEKPWHATIAGDGDPAPYRAMLNRYGLQSRISLPGWAGRGETAALLGAADILVLPSHHEAMPIAVLEALAAGVAVITTPVGAIPEILQDDISALLVTPGDPLQLAEAIRRLLEDAKLRNRLARAGHEVFRARLDIALIAERLADLYRTAMQPPGAVPRRHEIQAAE